MPWWKEVGTHTPFRCAVLSTIRQWYGGRANLKMEVTRKQSKRNFPKNEHFLPPLIRIRTCAYQWVRHVFFFFFFFRKTWFALFSCYFRFKIRPFVLLLSSYVRTSSYAYAYVRLLTHTYVRVSVGKTFFFFFFFFSENLVCFVFLLLSF